MYILIDYASQYNIDYKSASVAIADTCKIGAANDHDGWQQQIITMKHIQIEQLTVDYMYICASTSDYTVNPPYSSKTNCVGLTGIHCILLCTLHTFVCVIYI